MRLVVLIITALLTVSCVNRPSYSELESEIEDLEYKYRRLKSEYEEIESERDELQDIVERAKRACIIWDDDAYMALQILNEY